MFLIPRATLWCGMSTESEYWVVDRVTDGFVVVEGPQGDRTEIEAESLSVSVEEGVVLRVPRDERGAPSWADAVRDDKATEARRLEVAERIRKLRSRDPGGDLSL